ncbi:hypothetical protein ACOKW7_24190 [Limnospira platensis CENA597]|uniref:hypothetical protein n=1 Tax=Limnospira platensis TaxID=118562 RepID=UPI003D7018FA
MVTSTLTDYSLSERQWNLAHKVAIDLVLDDADTNELGKALSYLRAIQQEPDAGKRFLRYLETLAKQGYRIGHSKRTSGYFASMESVCKQYLQGDLENGAKLLAIIGWSFRLMRYYKDGVPPETIRTIGDEIEVTEGQSERQAEIAEAMEKVDISVGSKLEAIVAGIKGNRVTYEMLGTIRLTQKEPKKASSLSEGQTVGVEITELKDDETIKKVKLID